MGLIREPKNIDFTVQSKPWTDEELRDFRILMNDLKAKNTTKRNLKKPSVKKKIMTSKT